MSAFVPALPVQQLFRPCEPPDFDFKPAAEPEGEAPVIGQARALEALRFGVGIGRPGFNVFVLGLPASGKRRAVDMMVAEQAARATVPDDLCYVHHFASAACPRLLRLPAGRGALLRDSLAQAVRDLKTMASALFEGDEYRVRRQEIEDSFSAKQETALDALGREAEAHGFSMVRSSGGFAFLPVRDGKPIEPEAWEKLPDADRDRLRETVSVLKEHMQNLLAQEPRIQRELHQHIAELDATMLGQVAVQALASVRETFGDNAGVIEHLDAVQADIVAHPAWWQGDEGAMEWLDEAVALTGNLPPAQRYAVNVLVEHDAKAGAPVVHLDHPTVANLVGRIEHQARMGALVTDFRMIRAGALHRARGGYLIIDAHRLLTQPQSWEHLKRALRNGEIRIESLAESLGFGSTVSLEPEAAPLDIKIVLLGERNLYYLLAELDPEFPDLFKVAADFSSNLSREAADEQGLARLIDASAREEGLLPLDRTAIARLVEQASRHAGDARKLTAQIGRVLDIVREADYLAGRASAERVSGEHVLAAVAARDQRHGRLRELYLEETGRGVLLIDTAGSRVGQVNGLTVIESGGYTSGHPSRISAQVHIGKGDIVDIEREVELGGPIHSKGVLILGGYLAGHYGRGHPLSLSASIVLEQTYGGVEGDSASLAELFALLSAVTDIPLRQDIAVTGSINQLGDVQAVGGINEKIEGFFDVCAMRGLTGTQGVIIPQANAEHLMLRRDVVDAAGRGAFHIYAIENVDQGIELMAGRPAGARDEQGRYAEDSFNAAVELNLQAMAAHANADSDQDDAGPEPGPDASQPGNQSD